MRPVIDPRHGDVETDVSSTKRCSLRSAGPNLTMAWTLLLLVPGLLLGLGPIVVSDWIRTLSGTIATFVIGIWSLLVLAAVIALGYFGWRTLFRLGREQLLAVILVVVQPGYATTREVLRQIAERLFAKEREQGSVRHAACRLGHGGRPLHLRVVAACALSRLAERAPLRQLRGDRVLAQRHRRSARQQRRVHRRLSRHRRPDMGNGGCR